MDFSNENIIHVKDGDVEYIQFKKLLEYKDKLVHAYSLKPLDFRNKKIFLPDKHTVPRRKIAPHFCNSINLLGRKALLLPEPAVLG